MSIWGIDACLIELGGTHLVIEQSDSDQILQIVVGLLLGRRMVFGAEAAAPGEIEAALECLAGDRGDVSGGKVVAGVSASSTASMTG